MSKALLFIGVMSGSSLDGIDVALTSITNSHCTTISTYFQAYSTDIKKALLALHFPQNNELESAALMANQLAHLYADAVNSLLTKNNMAPNQVTAIGCHGQTVRHQPRYQDGVGYSIQLGNNALLAELTNITVIGDFRNRDIAAGGQGAPLVPAFHQAVFANTKINRAIVNIGGITNISYLAASGQTIGFDSGPGNLLIDYWVKSILGQDYDANGEWAATGVILEGFLQRMLADPYFSLQPPKSTGRDLFNEDWLTQHILDSKYRPQDVARTLVELTCVSLHQAITLHCPIIDEVYICGGGAHNKFLLHCLKQNLGHMNLSTTDALGVGVDWVEATAFAWLARQTLGNTPSNLPTVTGAKGPRILGAIFPN